MITFTPLAGSARSDISSRPLCYLLVIDDIRILLDCGDFPLSAAPELRNEYYVSLEKEAPSIDLVLFSHGNTSHLGLYPYAYAHWNLQAPAYASIPVQATGRMSVTEDADTIRSEQDVSIPKPETSDDVVMDEGNADRKPTSKRVPTRQDISLAFDSINTLRYSEPIHLGGKCQGITITPFSAGHTVGGTIWKIRSPSSGTIVYAVDLNHTKERHLDGTVILRSTGGGVFESLARPDLFITDADRTLLVTPRRKERDTAFLDIITSTIERARSVLIPCDASTRILELLVLLDQYWTFQKLSTPICLVSRTGPEMLAYVRSMVEWMGGAMSKEEGNTEIDLARVGKKRGRREEEEEEETAIGPVALRFKHVKFFQTPASLLAAYPITATQVILAVPHDMSHGPSRSLFTEFARDAGNTLILTSLGEQSTLSSDLFQLWNERQSDTDKWGKGKVGKAVRPNLPITVMLNSKVPLGGQELEDHLAREREEATRLRDAAQRAALIRSQELLEADEGDSEDDESDRSADDDDDDDEMAVDKVLGGVEGDEENDGLDHNERDPGARTVKGRGGALMNHTSNEWSMDDMDASRQLSFDIYLKGKVSKATSFFKTSSGATQRYRMYPYVDKSGGGMKRRVDEYGETLDVGMWLRRGRALDEDAESEEVKEAKRRKKEEEEAKKAPSEPPSKFITEEVKVHIACQMMYIDLEGLNDGRAVKTIVPQVNPRRMIVVHASTEAADALVESCSSIRAMTQQIFTPAIGESVTIGQHTKTFSISLADTLLASLNMSRFEDSEMAFLTGRVVSHANASIPVLAPLTSSAAPQAVTTTVTADEVEGAGPVASTSRTTLGAAATKSAPLPRSTMIGDLKLTALRSRLATLGLAAEFAGEGVLVCSGGGSGDLEQTVAVRKMGRGKITVEGNAGDVYFAVRKEVYALHAMVAQP
ncbi:hypothetical protein FRB96_006278 [Tulasnella sp. 330]|nr:hypothetical protein FRB96_006278 [Tulasnella sp. 330]KAG8885115.1 hypothetical protein FRB97_002281 [Tulasnella sp. 331]KAG8890597.1 hypothetical protein FRB98_007151 [Tulasnella sp. 332]